jgi:hypothetical protein
VVVKCFANASNVQQVTVAVPGIAQPMVFQGNGENNASIGSQPFTTGPTGPAITVTINSSPDGGTTWNPSDVYTGSCSIQAYNLTVIVTEDSVDQDYNDAVCMVSWPGRDSIAMED